MIRLKLVSLVMAKPILIVRAKYTATSQEEAKTFSDTIKQNCIDNTCNEYHVFVLTSDSFSPNLEFEVHGGSCSEELLRRQELLAESMKNIVNLEGKKISEGFKVPLRGEDWR